MTKMAGAFFRFVEGIKNRREYGTWRKLADAMEMTDSALERGAKKGTLKLPNLFALAAVTGEPLIPLLRLAGKPKEANQLAEIFGSDSPKIVTVAQRELLERWARLDADDRAYVERLLKRFDPAWPADSGRSNSLPDPAPAHDLPVATGRRRRRA